MRSSSQTECRPVPAKDAPKRINGVLLFERDARNIFEHVLKPCIHIDEMLHGSLIRETESRGQFIWAVWGWQQAKEGRRRRYPLHLGYLRKRRDVCGIRFFYFDDLARA
jgi:hypothetical protein